MEYAMFLVEQYHGETLMLAAIAYVKNWNHEACRIQDCIPVCWL
jgi:hypothetical protein